MVRRFCFFLIRCTLIPLLVRELIQRKKITIILYHDIKPETAEKQFKLLQSKYNIIALKDYVEAKKLGNVDKLPPKSLIITFDDGHKNNYSLRPILKKYNIPITIFLCSSIVDTNRHFWFKHGLTNSQQQNLKKLPDEKRSEILMKFNFDDTKEYEDRQALSKDEIEEMKEIVDFQSHTMFHPVLTKCSLGRTEKEILQSKKDLELNYGLRIYALSYPNGNYSDREILIANNADYECGITLDPGFNSQDTDLFRLKRICLLDDTGISELLVKSSGVWDYIIRRFISNKDI